VEFHAAEVQPHRAPDLSTPGLAVVPTRRVAVRCVTVKSFFQMGRVEVAVLVFLILFSAVSFLPIWRHVEFAGMVVFGWMMAALMVVSPALALAIFLMGRRRR
jgi:hypothetical protein